jgi:hypothetical protein
MQRGEVMLRGDRPEDLLIEILGASIYEAWSLPSSTEVYRH